MIYRAKRGQVSYGEKIGILMLDTHTPFIPGDVGNATTYQYPVRYRRVKGLTVERMLEGDPSALHELLEGAYDLVREGVSAITGDCGYMIRFQKELTSSLPVPVFLSSLLQVPFISKMLNQDARVGILCASGSSLTEEVLVLAGIHGEIQVAVRGLEKEEYFYKAFLQETGVLDREKVEEEVVAKACELAKEEKVKAILLECSVLPPYASAVQKAVNLPVFDYTTMIDYVFLGLVRRPFAGFM